MLISLDPTSPIAQPKRDAECDGCLTGKPLIMPLVLDTIGGKLLTWECVDCRMALDRAENRRWCCEVLSVATGRPV